MEADWLAAVVAEAGERALPLHAVEPDGRARLAAALDAPAAGFLRASGFAAEPGALLLLPGADGAKEPVLGGAVLGLGATPSPRLFGALPYALPEGSVWEFASGAADPAAALLHFCLGAHRFRAFRGPGRAPARILPPAAIGRSAIARALATARAVGFARDLINQPANLLGPAELADAAEALARAHGAGFSRITGSALEAGYPALAAVGAGSARAPVVAKLTWNGGGAGAPHIALCGKGVCFDSGGYDLKPSAGMLRMKKDMGGAAVALGIARLVMETSLPVRLSLAIGCVENSVSGSAMRPLDVLRTRRGLTVEVGNTDAEGRLLLADLLAEASDAAPDLLLDFATLTGAARVALGPELPALFANDAAAGAGWTERLLAAGRETGDPLWCLPLWDGYDCWLDSAVADLGNVSSRPFAGAIVAALFLRRFVRPATPWMHLDLYAWNDQTTPGRPEGGEAQGLHAVFAMLAGLAGEPEGSAAARSFQ